MCNSWGQINVLKTNMSVYYLFIQKTNECTEGAAQCKFTSTLFLITYKAVCILWSAIVTGDVSITCDAWKASNTDGYFAVTGHWIKEVASGDWNEEEALFGFMQMNTAHNRTCLGQALYKICS